MDSCIVTGSTGFLGSYAVDALSRSGRRVLAMTRKVVRSRHQSVQPVVASMEDLSPLSRAVSECGCDALLHFAAALPSANQPLTFEQAMAANVAGTGRLLDLIERTHCRVVIFISGTTVYAPSTEVLREDSAIGPGDAYTASKYCGEVCCNSFGTRTGTRVVSLRVSSPYGPGMHSRTVLPLFLGLALSGQVPRYHGTGGRTQDFVHAADVAQACLSALERGEGPYNIGGSSTSMYDLAKLALAATGRPNERPKPSGLEDPQEGRTFRLDVSRARRELLYTPEHELLDGMHELASAMRGQHRHEPWWEPS